MSNFFERVKPEHATEDDVKKALKEITEWDWTTGYSFAHVVIDDENLSDADILYCLRPSWVAEVMNQKLRDEFGFEPDFEKLETWQHPIYEKVIQHMAEVIDLLNWLLEVPISVREQI